MQNANNDFISKKIWICWFSRWPSRQNFCLPNEKERMKTLEIYIFTPKLAGKNDFSVFTVSFALVQL